jgi:cysteine-rich repeat protein
MLTRPLIALALFSRALTCVPEPKEAAVTDGPTTVTSAGGTETTTDPTDPTVPTGTDPTIPPECGNGEIDGNEACDDGNDDNTDACLINCVEARCGDGFVYAGVEECDDGDQIDTNDCTTACKPAVCGDGIVWDGVEECDDGNDIDDDGCTNGCKLPACGDGILNGDEQCDDGGANVPPENAHPTDCTTACRHACGDGVRSSHEECDDDNQDPGDGCNAACEHEYLMFATADLHTADLGGVAGADAICQAAAAAGGLPGVYVAWVSVDADHAAADLPSGKPLVRTDGLPIVAVAEQLIQGGTTTLLNPIDRDETGAPVTGYAWTGTSFTGQASGNDCDSWALASPALATIGALASTNSRWTNDSLPEPFIKVQCSAINHLYCFRTLEP